MYAKTLNVKYLTQPTSNTCQSTCLKMIGTYLASEQAMSSVVDGMSIQDIWKEINEGAERPSKLRNSYENMVWWLNRYFPGNGFAVTDTKSTTDATSFVVSRIDAKLPVMVSTNHSRTDGHIILVIGYENVFPNASSKVSFICHDPYGKFDPQAGSKDYGKRRYNMGMSMAVGGEVGPGRAVSYDHSGIQRSRSDKHSAGTYFLISGAVH